MNKLQINSSAPASARHEITINATPARVWNILTSVNQWSDWLPHVSKAKLRGPLTPGTSFDWKNNGFSIHSTLHDVKPNARISWTGQTFGANAIHIWEISPKGRGVIVTTEESMDGWLVRMMRSSTQKMLDHSLDESLTHLKLAAEKETK